MTVKFEANPASQEDLDAVIAMATFLRDRIGTDGPGLVSTTTPPSPAALADQLVIDLKGRIGTKLTNMLVAEAKLSEKGDYTMVEARESDRTDHDPGPVPPRQPGPLYGPLSPRGPRRSGGSHLGRQSLPYSGADALGDPEAPRVARNPHAALRAASAGR